MSRFLVFLGSARDSTPPAPARLGLRVARACVELLEADGACVELIDPLEIELGTVFKPHFAYAKAKVPEALESLAGKIAAAPWASSAGGPKPPPGIATSGTPARSRRPSSAPRTSAMRRCPVDGIEHIRPSIYDERHNDLSPRPPPGSRSLSRSTRAPPGKRQHKETPRDDPPPG